MQLQSIALVGLAGSGKSRLKQAIQASDDGVECSELSTAEDLTSLSAETRQAIGLVLCVIDVRSPLQAQRDDWLEAELKQLISASDAVVFNFLEASGLEEQAWWGRWIKHNAEGLPILRVMNGHLPAHWPQWLLEAADSSAREVVPLSEEVLPDLQTYQFAVGRICLDHLLMGLDSSKQNLGMKISRVTGVVDTLEYDNIVAIEGSALRWDMFAAEQNSKVGVITIQGFDLDRTWLEELIKASLV